MIDDVKKFFSNLSHLEIVLFSLVLGAFSTVIPFQNALIQFIFTSLCAIVICFLGASFVRLFNSSALLISIFSSLVLVLFSQLNEVQILVVFHIISIFVIVLPNINKNYLLAIQAHLADIVTTFISLSTLREANPVMRYFMDLTGALPALFLVKTILVGSVLIILRENYKGLEQRLLLKSIALIGFSMSARNIFLFLN